jgi:hypothetical protein
MAQYALSSRVLSECEQDCGTILLTEGREIVFELGFFPSHLAKGITLSNPKVASTALMQLNASSGKAADAKYQLSLASLSEGSSNLVIRDAAGKVLANYGFRVVPGMYVPASRGRDELLFRGAVPKDETVVFILVSDDVSMEPLEQAHEGGFWAVEGRRVDDLPEPIPVEFKHHPIRDLIRRDLGMAASEFDQKGARLGLIINGPVPISCQSVLVTQKPALNQWPAMQKSILEVPAAGRSDFYRSLSTAVELLRLAQTPKKRIVLYSHCGNFCGDDFMVNSKRILEDLRHEKQHIRIDMRMYGAATDQMSTLKDLSYYTGGTFWDYRVGGCHTPDPPQAKIKLKLGDDVIPFVSVPEFIHYPMTALFRYPAPTPAPQATETSAVVPVRRPPVIPVGHTGNDSALTTPGVYHKQGSSGDTPPSSGSSKGSGGAR